MGRSCPAGGIQATIQADVASTDGYTLQGDWCNWLFSWCWWCKMYLLGWWLAVLGDLKLCYEVKLEFLSVCFVMRLLGKRVRDQPQIGAWVLIDDEKIEVWVWIAEHRNVTQMGVSEGSEGIALVMVQDFSISEWVFCQSRCILLKQIKWQTRDVDIEFLCRLSSCYWVMT